MLAEAQLFKLSQAMRRDIRTFERGKNKTYQEVLDADRGNIWEMWLVNVFIIHLERCNHSLKDIMEASQQDEKYVRNVIEYARKKETPIQTTRYQG